MEPIRRGRAIVLCILGFAPRGCLRRGWFKTGLVAKAQEGLQNQFFAYLAPAQRKHLVLQTFGERHLVAI